MSPIPPAISVVQSYELVFIVVSSAAVVLVFLGFAWLSIQPSRHRRTKMALLGAELVMLGTLAWVDLAADAQLRAHARRLACHARLERIARLLVESQRLDSGTPKSFPPELSGLAIVPEYRAEDLECPMDDTDYDYERSARGDTATVTGRPITPSPFDLARGFHTLRIDSKGYVIAWTEAQR